MPKQVRIVSFVLVIATFVTIVDYAIQAISLDLHKALGAFIALIVVNCIILGRAEAFASKNGVVRSALDGLGMGLGFTLALLCLGCVREVLGKGALFGHPIVSGSSLLIMILPAGGFLAVGLLMGFFNWIDMRFFGGKGASGV